MLERILSRLTYANVVASVALFLALGGGYALAVSGDGKLQKGKVNGIGTAFEDVRTLTGIGSIQAQCVTGAPDPSLSVRLHNTTANAIRYRFLSIDNEGPAVSGGVGIAQANNNSTAFEVAAGEDYVHLYLFSGVADAKQPQANIEIGTREVTDCASSSVSVLALNTEE
jgi:hypothetical protein